MARSKHASPTLVLKITDEVVQDAIKSNSGGCLIADAIKKQYPQFSGVTVDMATIRVSDRKAGVRYTYLTPKPAQHCLLSFDQGWPNAIDEITLRRAVQVVQITGPQSRIPDREARRAELEEKQAANLPMTQQEKAALTTLRRPNRPASRGAREVKVVDHGSQHGAVIFGGEPILQGESHPNLLRGRDRHFGAKLADPGKVFHDAVEKAVEQRLAEAATQG